MADVPTIRYVRNGDVALAYQVLGDGPIDLVFLPSFLNNLEIAWESPLYARFLRRLASVLPADSHGPARDGSFRSHVARGPASARGHDGRPRRGARRGRVEAHGGARCIRLGHACARCLPRRIRSGLRRLCSTPSPRWVPLPTISPGSGPRRSGKDGSPAVLGGVGTRSLAERKLRSSPHRSVETCATGTGPRVSMRQSASPNVVGATPPSVVA